MSDKTLKVKISGTNFKLTDSEQEYVDKKLQKLVNHMSEHGRESAFVSCKITRIDQKTSDDNFQCDVVLTLPEKSLVASETAQSIQAAIDGAEPKLQGQIRRYKTERTKA